MVLTRSQHKKSMEQNKETSTSSDLSQTERSINLKMTTNPTLDPTLPPQPNQDPVQVEDITNSYKGRIDDELLEHMQNLETHQLITTIMRLNPNQYMLELAKEGFKIPSKFDVSTILEPPLVSLPLTIFTPTFNTPFHQPLPNTNVGLTLPLSPYQPLTMKNTSLLKSLQNHPLVNTQTLEANSVLRISPNGTSMFTPLTFNNSTMGSTFKATPYDPNWPPNQVNSTSLVEPLVQPSSYPIGVTL
jgi:hypothetical protein